MSHKKKDKRHYAVQKLLFAMRIYPGYPVESRGPSGCILAAIEALEPEVAKQIQDGADPGDLMDPSPDEDRDRAREKEAKRKIKRKS